MRAEVFRIKIKFPNQSEVSRNNPEIADQGRNFSNQNFPKFSRNNPEMADQGRNFSNQIFRTNPKIPEIIRELPIRVEVSESIRKFPKWFR